MDTKVLLLLLTVMVQLVLGLDCQQGENDSYYPVTCDRTVCSGGIDCLCAKIVETSGRIERGCWANPFGAQRVGCSRDYYHQGKYVTLCTCESNLCNASPSSCLISKSVLALTALMCLSFFFPF